MSQLSRATGPKDGMRQLGVSLDLLTSGSTPPRLATTRRRPGSTQQVKTDPSRAETGVPFGELSGPRKGGRIAFARCLAAYLARRFAHIPVRRIARRLRRDDSSFARPLARLELRLEQEPALRDQIDRILKTLHNPQGQQPNPLAPANPANQD